MHHGAGPIHAGAEDVGLVAPAASDRAEAIGADVEMLGVVLAPPIHRWRTC